MRSHLPQYADNVRTFANGRDYEFEVDFNQSVLDVSHMTFGGDSTYYFSDVARALMDFVANNETYRIVNATEAFVQAVRREAKRRNLAIWFGFPKDQFGNIVDTNTRLLTRKENAQ